MNFRNAKAPDGRPIAPVYGVWDGEILIDAPVKTVWHYIINYPTWQNFPVRERISGRRDAEGEIILLRKDEKGFEFPPYYAITIKLEPERHAIWKTYPAETPEVDFFGIVQFMIEEVQGKTRFHYNTVYEFAVPYREEHELETYRKQQIANFDTLLAGLFPRLKKLCEEHDR